VTLCGDGGSFSFGCKVLVLSLLLVLLVQQRDDLQPLFSFSYFVRSSAIFFCSLKIAGIPFLILYLF
jgi:hypothetical protein